MTSIQLCFYSLTLWVGYCSKAVRSGIPAIASLGALSTAAIDLARDNGVILYGFVKENGGWKVGL